MQINKIDYSPSFNGHLYNGNNLWLKSNTERKLQSMFKESEGLYRERQKLIEGLALLKYGLPDDLFVSMFEDEEDDLHIRTSNGNCFKYDAINQRYVWGFKDAMMRLLPKKPTDDEISSMYQRLITEDERYSKILPDYTKPRYSTNAISEDEFVRLVTENNA